MRASQIIQVVDYMSVVAFYFLKRKVNFLSDFSTLQNFMYYNINSLIIFLKRESLVITFYRNKSGQQCYRQEETGGGCCLKTGQWVRKAWLVSAPWGFPSNVRGIPSVGENYNFLLCPHVFPSLPSPKQSLPAQLHSHHPSCFLTTTHLIPMKASWIRQCLWSQAPNPIRGGW